MLIQFAVENVLSFRDKVVLSAMAAPGIEHNKDQVFKAPNGMELLRVLALYGANASGKSNLVKALQWAKKLVVEGTPAGKPITTSAFKLSSEHRSKPSSAEFEVLVGEKHFSYGFVVDAEKVESEWLYVTISGQEEMLFEREEGQITRGEAIASSSERQQFIKFVAEGTRPNQLFLHEILDRNVSELSDLLSWFQSAIVQTSREHAPEQPPQRLVKDEKLRSFAVELLKNANTGVVDLKKTFKVENPVHLQHVFRLFNSAISNEQFFRDARPFLSDEDVFRFEHQSRDGSKQFFGVEEESDGTLRLLNLAPLLFDLLHQKKITVAVIDEIDSSLHTLLTRHFIQQMLTISADEPGQLIFTTHDTNLLDLTLLSADSVWLLEKDGGGASSLYSLAEFKSEQLKQLTGKVEQGYLQGRFGGIPFLGDPERLGWLDKE